MPTQYTLMPLPKVQFLGNNGLPLSGGYLYTYYPGTTSPKSTYANSQGTSFNTNPIVLDSQGRASVWLDGAYDIELWSGDRSLPGSTMIMSQQNVSVSSQPATVDPSQFFSGFSKITVSGTAPINPSNNDLWVDTTV